MHFNLSYVRITPREAINFLAMMSHISKSLWAYLAGFLDGDGSIYVRVKPNDTYRYGFQISPSVVFFQSIKEKVKIQKMQKSYGVGYIRERNDGIIEWVVGDEKSIRLLMKSVTPFLILKTEQAKLMLEVLNSRQQIKSEEDFVNVVKNIDRFQKLNYSKKRSVGTEKVLAYLKLKLDIKLKRKNLLAP